jgi:hypothetical protein
MFLDLPSQVLVIKDNVLYIQRIRGNIISKKRNDVKAVTPNDHLTIPKNRVLDKAKRTVIQSASSIESIIYTRLCLPGHTKNYQRHSLIHRDGISYLSFEKKPW